MLETGTQIPELTLQDHSGSKRTLSDYYGKPMVIYFYPKNETPGCVAEACSFRDSYEDFTNLGAEVIGISGDSVSSHHSFIQKRKLPFILLSDKHRKAEKAFGVKRNFLGLIPGRVTFVISSNGEILHIFDSASNPRKHIKESLRILKKYCKSTHQ